MGRINKDYHKHFFAVSALFVLGNGVITQPQADADRYNFLAFLLTCGLTILFYFLFLFVPIGKAAAPLFMVLAFYSTADSFITFINFIKNDLLTKTQPFFIALPFVLLLLYIASVSNDVLFKFSFLSFFVIIFVVVIFFFSTIKDFDFKNIVINQMPDTGNVFSQMLSFIKTVVLPVAVLAFFARFNKFNAGTAIIGIGAGLTIFAVCLLNSVLLFGNSLSAKLDYPYSAVGSTVTFGDLFTRLDGFLYLFYLCTVLVKCAVGIDVIKKQIMICKDT